MLCVVWVFPPDLTMRTKDNVPCFQRISASDRLFFLRYSVNVFLIFFNYRALTTLKIFFQVIEVYDLTKVKLKYW